MLLEQVIQTMMSRWASVLITPTAGRLGNGVWSICRRLFATQPFAVERGNASAFSLGLQTARGVSRGTGGRPYVRRITVGDTVNFNGERFEPVRAGRRTLLRGRPPDRLADGGLYVDGTGYTASLAVPSNAPRRTAPTGPSKGPDAADTDSQKTPAKQENTP